MKTKTSHTTNSMSRSLLRRGLLIIPLAFACSALSPAAHALLPPPRPDGGYPNNNTAEGDNALFSLTTGTDNTANGFAALVNNTSGSFNTASGSGALYSNTGGVDNTATGFEPLFSNTTGSNNTATGLQALFNNTTGGQNTANGVVALYSNTHGSNNTADGFGALYNNTTGSHNTATGFGALSQNTTGVQNTANGTAALATNITGINNTATGFQALLVNFAGNGNTANGAGALYFNTTGNRNTANGIHALQSNFEGNFNVAEGAFALSRNTSGSSNIALGFNAGSNLTTGSNNIDIGALGMADESGKIRIGRQGLQTATFIAGIRGIATANANAIPVLIDSTGQLGTASSSRRFKKEIKPMDRASEAILALKPVTFHYKSDNSGTPQFGLIAEEVAQANPDLVVRDENGEIYTVRYDAVNAMLLNEFLKEHRKNEEQEATIARQQKQIEALAAGLQKVSAQLELSKPAPQVAENNQ
jgi:Chaperone of endosialidase